MTRYALRPRDEHLEVGQIAYESFHHELRDLGWVRWEDLPWREQEAWRIAAREVIQRGWMSSQRRRH